MKQPMKAVIMAGGFGTRLSSVIKNEIPKALVPFAGKPLIEYQIDRLRENKITDITILVGYLKERLIEHLGDGKKYGVSINYVAEDEPLGSAGALSYLSGKMDDDFLVLFCDIVFDIDIDRMLRFHREKSSVMTLFVHPNSHPYDSDLITTNEDMRVKALIKASEPRPKHYRNLSNASVFIINSHALSYIKPVKTDMEGGFVRTLLNAGEPVYAYTSTEYVEDVGTPERLKNGEQDFLVGVTAARNLKNKQRAIFLDRDGVINRYVGYVAQADSFELLPETSKAIAKINQSGYLAIVVTNQGMISAGKSTEAALREIHNKMETELAAGGAYLDDIFYCPHHDLMGDNCECRKPKPGMILLAEKKFNIDLRQSWIIGDSNGDIIAGQSVGVKTIKLPTNDPKYDKCNPDFIANNLLEAVNLILEENK